jgi:tetratricopeptide (TPR) repeat protein
MSLLSRLFADVRRRDDPAELHRRAVRALHEGRAAEAVPLLEGALDERPGEADWWYDLGEACRLSGNLPRGEAAYSRALELRPDLGAARKALYEMRLAVAGGHFEARRLTEAQAAFVTAIRIDRLDPRAQQGLVSTLEARIGAGPSVGAPEDVELPSGVPTISVVICSVDPVKFADVTAMYGRLLAGVPHEIVAIHDARSLCEGYNRALRQARGEWIVFSHDDIEVLADDFAARLARHLTSHQLVGVCGTSRLTGGTWHAAGWPHLRGLVAHRYPDSGRFRVMVLDAEADVSTDVQALDGLFFAARREVVERIRFDEQTFDGFHLYDLDFSFAAHLAGFDVAVCHDIPMIHYTYADASGYVDAYREYIGRFERKYAGRLSPVEPAETRFLQALFDDKRQVKAFCDALVEARRTAFPQ